MRYQKRRCSPPPSPHRQVVVGRGRAGTEVRRARSYLLRQGRDCLQQSCAAVSSAYWTLACWWASQLFFLGRFWFQAFLRAVLRLPALRLLRGCFPVWVRVVLGSCCLRVGLVGPISSPPGVGVGLLLCVFAFFVCSFFVLVLYVCWGVCRSVPSFLVTLDFADFLAVYVFGPFRGIFRVAGYPPGGEICGM